jgi:putative membrane protein insertion efficiency factor
MKKAVLKILVFYKKHISGGSYCRMIPTCSQYTYEAVEKYGAEKGLWLGLVRVLKCHPWGKSGVDLLK